MGSEATNLKELNDKEEMELIGLSGNLKTHEMKRKTREEKAPQKKKMLTFKFTPTIFNEEEEEDEDEDLSLLVKNVRRIYNKAKFNNRRKWQGSEDKKIVCYNCRKLRHVIAECLKNKAKPTTFKKPYKKKALKATWDSESKFEEEVDTAHVCFMVNENTPKVASESYLDKCELSMNKAFEELSNNYDFLKKNIWK